MYGSCVIFDFAAKKMYILNANTYSDAVIPNVENVQETIDITTIIDSQSDRYKLEFGRIDRKIKCRISNYYTGLYVEGIINDENNKSLAGNGYDKPKIASDNGIIIQSVQSYCPNLGNIDNLFVGDSVSDGRNILLSDSWTYKLSQLLGGNTIIAARSGGQIRQVIDFIDDWGKIIRPRKVIVSIGVNGGNSEQLFDELYTKIKGIGAIPIINTIYNAKEGFNNISSEDWIKYNNYILSLPCRHIRFDIATSANKYTPTWYDIDSNYTLTDTVHPDANGSDILVNRAKIDIGDLFVE